MIKFRGYCSIILYAHTCLRLKKVWTLWTVDKYTKIDNCKYATTTIFFVLNCIFFGFRAFYPLFIHFFAVILHRNLNQRTLIALSSRFHLICVHVWSTSEHGVSCRWKPSFKIRTTSKLYFSTSKLYYFLLDNEK